MYLKEGVRLDIIEVISHLPAREKWVWVAGEEAGRADSSCGPGVECSHVCISRALAGEFRE